MRKTGYVLLGISLLLAGCSNTAKSEQIMKNEDYVEKFNTMYHEFFDAEYKEYALKNEYSGDDEGNTIVLDKMYTSGLVEFIWIQGSDRENRTYCIVDSDNISVYGSDENDLFTLSETIENRNSLNDYNNSTPFETTQYTYDESKTECNDSTYIFYFDSNVEEYTNCGSIKLEAHVKDDRITDYTIYNYYTDSDEEGKEPYYVQTYYLITNIPSQTLDDLKEEVNTLEGQEISAMDHYKPTF